MSVDLNGDAMISTDALRAQAVRRLRQDADVVVRPQTLLALVDAVEAAEELKLWEPGRAGYAAALNRLFKKTARFDSGVKASA